jgi:bisanhydrobacterioruberin hydratase
MTPASSSLQHRVALLDRRPWVGWALFLIFYGVGIVGHLPATTRPLMLAMTPFFLPLMGVLSLSVLLLSGHRRLWLWATGTVVATWAIEVVGVHTGLVFGEYLYGKGLGAPLLGVPPLIGFNWFLVCLGTLLWVLPWAESRGVSRLGVALVVAILAMGFDWVMEPVAMTLGYWSWTGGDIPLQNYAAWFVIAFLASLSYLYLPEKDRARSRLPAIHVAVQLLFFAGLRLGLGGG